MISKTMCVAALAAVIATLPACSRTRVDRPTAAASSNTISFEGAPAMALLAGGADLDVPGELAVRVPDGWIGKQQIAPQHALFQSRDGAVLVMLTNVGATRATDEQVLVWTAKPWTKVTKPSLGPFKDGQLGRSAFRADKAVGKATLDGVPADVSYARFSRDTSVGVSNMLVALVASEKASPADRARGEAMVRSLGPR